MGKNKSFKFNIVLYALSAMFILASCGKNSSDSFKKDSGKQEIPIIKIDSVKNNQNEIDRDKTVNLNISQKEQAKVDSNTIMNEKLKNINKIVADMEGKVKIIDDSLNYYAAKLTEVNFKIDELSSKKKYVSETNLKSKENITSNIAELEANINALKISKSKEEDNLNLIIKKKELTEKKKGLLTTELDYKQSEINELYTHQNSENEIQKLKEEISTLNKNIEDINNQLLEEDLNQKLSRNKINDIEKKINEKQNLFKTEYEKSEGFASYVKKEKETIDKDLEKLKEKRAELSIAWKEFKKQKESILNEMEQPKIEQRELFAKLAKEEQDSSVVKLQSESSENIIVSKEITESKESLVEHDSINKNIDTLKNNNVQKLMTESKVKSKSSDSVLYWFIIIIILIIAVLYWIGKKNKKISKKN